MTLQTPDYLYRPRLTRARQVFSLKRVLIRGVRQLLKAMPLFGAGAMLMAGGVVMADVQYSVRSDSSQYGAFTVYAQSDRDIQSPQSIVGSAQVTLVLPDGAVINSLTGGEAFKVTDNPNSDGIWSGEDYSDDISAPEVHSDTVDIVQVQIAPTGPSVNFFAGEEVALFSFVASVCEGELRLIDNSEAFAAEKPNSRGLASANSWITLDDEQYSGNYRTGEAPCS